MKVFAIKSYCRGETSFAHCLWIGFLSLFMTVCLFPLHVAGQDSATKKDLKTILDKLDEISQRVNELEVKETPEDSTKKMTKDVEAMKEDMQDYADILWKVETKTLTDKINLGADLRAEIDWFDFTGHDYVAFTGQKVGPMLNEKINFLPSNRFRLHLKASLGKNLKFSSRIAMYKHWEDDDYPVYPEANFLNASRIRSDLNLRVDRAYIDYFFDPFPWLPAALTLGRMPMTDGLPTDLKEDTPRKSTYPALAYDCEADGMALSLILTKLIPLPETAFRSVYIRRYDDNEKFVLGQRLSDKTGYFRRDENAMKPVNIIIFQLETGFPAPLNDTVFFLNYVTIPDTPPSDLRYNASLLSFYNGSSSALYVKVPDSEGTFEKYTAFFETKSFLGSPIDWFIDFSYGRSRAKGAIEFMFKPSALGLPGNDVLARDAYSTYKTLIDNLPDMGATLKQLQSAPTKIGCLNNDGVSDRTSYAYHVGLRYRLPFEALKESKIGLEYNAGSRYWWAVNSGAEDPLHKLDARGDVWEIFYIQPLTSNLMMRAGHMSIDYDYDQGLSFYHGEPLEIDHKILHTYFIIEAKF